MDEFDFLKDFGVEGEVDDGRRDSDLAREHARQSMRHKESEHKERMKEILQDRKLKQYVAARVFFLLTFEIAMVFLIIWFQGLHFLSIDADTLKIFFPVVMTQVSVMGIIITKSLFPKK